MIGNGGSLQESQYAKGDIKWADDGGDITLSYNLLLTSTLVPLAVITATAALRF